MPTTAVDAQREGFEPPEPFGSPVFKTGTISQTRTSLHAKITMVCFYARLSIKLRLRQAQDKCSLLVTYACEPRLFANTRTHIHHHSAPRPGLGNGQCPVIHIRSLYTWQDSSAISIQDDNDKLLSR